MRNTVRKYKAAIVQMNSGRLLSENLDNAEQLIKQAKQQGAALVVLPENFAVFNTSQMYKTGVIEASDQPVIRAFLSRQAKLNQIFLVAGTLPVATVDTSLDAKEQRVRAASFLYDDRGEEMARYDKIHLFDANIADGHGSYRESDTFEPGDQPVAADTPLGKIGMSVCYDLRFPELYRILFNKGAQLITVPSAFTATTGEAHWEPLLRARAIENLSYVLASNQCGSHGPNRRTWGRSMIIDPWGKVIAQAGDEPTVIVAEIDLDLVSQHRADLPVAEHQRFS
ncbi:MAG: carbon-nitrogen hydrolase family protein [Pseudomonadales bacterium]|nr:carbon-nitrogen hydrolase family protein [Pseudomonadales bacterium]